MSPVRNTSLARLAHRLSPAAFLRWWGQGLWLCLPPALRERLSGPPPQLLIEQVDDELRISEVDGSRVKELSRYPRALLSEGLPDVPRPRDREVVLCLTPRQTLARTLNLPLAAEANLRQVVGFELDRLTPFPPNRIYYDARVIERRTDQRSVRVRFVAVLRDTLEPLLAQLRASGLAPERVVLAGDDSGCNLLPAERRRRRRRWGERVQLMLMVLLGITILVALALPLWQLRSQVVDLLPRVAVARQEAEEVMTLRQRLDSLLEASRFLLQKRREEALSIEVLEELTRILPDHTWVEQFEMNDDRVELRGQSREATTLLALVENSPLFQGATFRSPITSDRRTNNDRFYLVAEIADVDSRAAD